MHCIYINLDSAVDRRETIEENFKKYMAQHGFVLHRYPAKTVEDVFERDLPGIQTNSAKACYLSHIGAIEKSMDFSEPVLILEDDACFGERTGEKLNEAMSKFTGSDIRWDMFFTDVIFGDFTQMAELFWDNKIWKRRERQIFKIFDLKGWSFCGMSAYIINNSSKIKIKNILENQSSIDHLNDIYVRNNIQEDKIKAYTIFPFLTSVSNYAKTSQVQSNEFALAIKVIDAFRRLCWNDLDIESLDADELLEGIGEDFFDKETEYFSNIIKIIGSNKFKPI